MNHYGKKLNPNRRLKAPKAVIVPGTTKLPFKLDLEGGSDDDLNSYNLARNLVKEVNVRLRGHTTVSYQDTDVFHNFKDN